MKATVWQLQYTVSETPTHNVRQDAALPERLKNEMSAYYMFQNVSILWKLLKDETSSPRGKSENKGKKTTCNMFEMGIY